MNRHQQKINTRNSIKIIAKQEFLINGINATNTREISAKSGVAVGTFFSHFPDKMTLIKEIFFDEMDITLTSKLNHFFAESNSHPCDFIDNVAIVLFDFYLQHRQYTMIVLGQSLLNRGFFQTQLQGIKDNINQRFQKIEVDEASAHIFAENMVGNFQYVLLEMLASASLNKTPWLRNLQQLNLPFDHIYQNALKRLES